IEDDVWIGANCVLLDGAILRQGCVIGAGSIVRGEVPAYAIAHGQPAMVKGYRS
ncbi:MAG: acyltransferase, partial [Alphaproteobacteria bacterium]|nr:acyltransferase [Alphaproteobacteria bacterium]